MAQHAKERLLDVQVDQAEVDAVGLHAAVGERARTVVLPARERHAKSGHGGVLFDRGIRWASRSMPAVVFGRDAIASMVLCHVQLIAGNPRPPGGWGSVGSLVGERPAGNAAA